MLGGGAACSYAGIDVGGPGLGWRLVSASAQIAGGWPDQEADGEMAMCGYTWAMIINRLGDQVARGQRAPYFTVGEPLPS